MTITTSGVTAAKRATPRFIGAANTASTFSPRSRSRLWSPTNLVDGAVQAILTAAATGKIGDGKIFLSKVDEVIRIQSNTRVTR